MDFTSITRIWEQLLFNIRWLIYYLWWSIANRNSHFSFSHHTERKRSASYLEWNGKCFITKLLHLKRLHFYEARPSAYEAALRAMKRTFGAWSEAFSGFMFFCLEIKAKKWRLEIFISTRHSETHFEAKNSEYTVKIKEKWQKRQKSFIFSIFYSQKSCL